MCAWARVSSDVESKGTDLGHRYFTRGVFDFLRELEANNNKVWWEDNKDRYITIIQQPALDFIEDFGDKLNVISPHFVADSRVNGGSLMRPYRDIRFSKDKTPYKTNVGIHFRHVRGKDVHAPGLYVHLEPAQNFSGIGLWSPEAKVARAIRQAINDDPAAWRKAAHTKTFTDVWSLSDHEEDYLKRVPKELDPDHPYPDDLRLKSFTAGASLNQSMVTSADFAEDLLVMFRRARAYAGFLCDAIGVPF